MNTTTLDLLLRVFTLAAQLGRAIGPSEATGFFRSILDGSITANTAAEKAAAALSLALDVGILAAELSALQTLLITSNAVAQMDRDIRFTDPLPIPLSPKTESGFAALESALSGGGTPADG